jgi:hypothetical protein
MKNNLWLQTQDAEYVLKPIVKLLAAKRTSRAQERAIRSSVGRYLRIAAQDARLPRSLAVKHVDGVLAKLNG